MYFVGKMEKNKEVGI